MDTEMDEPSTSKKASQLDEAQIRSQIGKAQNLLQKVQIALDQQYIAMVMGPVLDFVMAVTWDMVGQTVHFCSGGFESKLRHHSLHGVCEKEKPSTSHHGAPHTNLDVRAVQGDANGGLEVFMSVEKQCRLAEDMKLSQETCLAIINGLHEHNQWQLLLEHIALLTKRRGQLKSTIQVCLPHTCHQAKTNVLAVTVSMSALCRCAEPRRILKCDKRQTNCLYALDNLNDQCRRLCGDAVSSWVAWTAKRREWS